MKKDLQETVGKCPVCTINLYGNEKTPYPNSSGKKTLVQGKPRVLPCGVGPFRDKNRETKERRPCPFEKAKDQLALMQMRDGEVIAGLLGTQRGD